LVSERIRRQAPVHVLIVDDDEDLLQLVESAVKQRYPSFHVHVARDGIEALEMTRRGTAPDLVFTDIKMPRLGGTELCKSLKAAYHGQVNVTAMTAGPKPAGNDFDNVLSKPFDLAALYIIIDGALRKWARKS
jgi:CheY-like chemotaxis protein